MNKNVTIEEIETVMAHADCLYTETQVEEAIYHMAAKISSTVGDSNPLLLCVMNGGIVPTGKLVTKLQFPLQIDYVHATRYRGKTAGGQLNWIAEPQFSLRDRVVLVIDDILDEGITLHEIMEYCKRAGASAVYSVVLVEKMHDRKQNGIARADFAGLQVEDRYVFGYGMDYKNYLRNAPGIFAVT